MTTYVYDDEELTRPVTTPGINPTRRRWGVHPCEHGHFDCSFREGGPCENEHRRLHRIQTGDHR